MKGWFDAFRDDGGPTLYSFSNRTPVTGDVSIVAVSVLFATIYLAFLVIFPGVRKQRFTTFSTVTLSLFVGLVIFITRLGSSWHIASTTIVAPYKAFSREKIAARIGTHIGLMHVNVTLTALQIGNWTVPDIDYNERFGWEGATDMKANYHEALKRGLPYPILTVAEYFSLGREGFSWGGQYRAAGYFASILLWTSVASWLLMNLLLVAVPRYGGYMKTLTGFLIVCTNIGYYLLLPKRPLTIYLEGGKLEFRLGWCYWLLLVAGILCFSVGIIISVVDLVWPHTFSTVLEVYYDTPYDRHVILEESRDVRYRKRNSKSLEDPHGGLGSRILRRLSSKNKDSSMAGPSTSLDSRNVAASSTGGISGGSGGGGSSGISGSISGGSSGIGRSNNSGIDNKGFQNDVPKSPWRYPFRRAQQILPPSSRNALKRTVSQDSASSIHSASVQISPMHKQALSRVLPKPPLERTRDMVHW